jgi:hypothetical protein
MSSEASINIHNIVNIKPSITHFSDFTTYEWKGRDKHGASFSVTFYHTHRDGFVIEPVTERIIETRKSQHEDVTPTL